MDSQLGATLVGHHELEQHPKVAKFLGRVVDACLYVIVVALPILFFPFTLDGIEMPKQAFLLVVTSLALVAWIGQGVSARRFSLARSWMHLIVAAFLVGYILVSVFSHDRYLSFAGSFGQMQWAVATVVGFVLFYVLVANSVKGTTKLYHLILAFLGGSFVVGVIGLLQMYGVDLFGYLGAFMRGKTFNTVGTINALGVFMTVPLILAASLTVLGCRDKVCVLGRGGKPSHAAMALVWATLILGTFIAIVLDYWVVWATILFGTTLLIVLPILRRRRFPRPLALIVPGVLVALSIVLLLFRTPINIGLPSEVAPSASATWAIARSTLQTSPLVGSGPGTWMYDYASYRSPKVNVSQFWTVRFERGLTAFLTLFAMIGLVGVALWLMVVISAIVKSSTHLVLERDDDAWQAYLTVFTGWATVTFTAFVYNYNVTHHLVFWFLLALLASLVTRGSLVWDMRKSVVHSSIFSVAFIFACVIGVSAMWLSVQRIIADSQYARAVHIYQSGGAIEDATSALLGAVALNHWDDAYYRNLSQAYLIQANQVLQGTPNAERAQKVNTFVSSSVNAAKQATDITPANVDNWFNFARVLRAIAPFTRGADEKAIQMYQEAQKREPNSPVYLNEIGQMYILRSDAFRSLLQSNDPQVKKDAETNMRAELDKAAEALNQAIQLKPDFAEAHYNLGLVYDRQGRIPDAISRLEQALNGDKKNVGVAFQLAILYYRNNEKDRSLNMFEQLVAFDPNYSNARWYLATIYEERGRLDDAIAQVQKVKELNPDNKMIDDRLKTLLDERAHAQKPTVGPLPEPLKEEVNSSPEQNAVKSR